MLCRIARAVLQERSGLPMGHDEMTAVIRKSCCIPTRVSYDAGRIKASRAASVKPVADEFAQ